MQHHIASGQVGWDWRTWFEQQEPLPHRGDLRQSEGGYEYDYEYYLDREHRRRDREQDEPDALDPQAEDSTPA